MARNSTSHALFADHTVGLESPQSHGKRGEERFCCIIKKVFLVCYSITLIYFVEFRTTQQNPHHVLLSQIDEYLVFDYNLVTEILS